VIRHFLGIVDEERSLANWIRPMGIVLSYSEVILHVGPAI
jgi:hypothetical protein